MSSREYAGWIAFDRIEPIGPHRQDLRIAQLCSLFANAHLPRAKRTTASDFMPWGDYRNDRLITDVEAQKNYFRSLASRRN